MNECKIIPKFNIDNYQGNFVMHCNTEEKAEIFCNYLDSMGRRWFTEESYKNNTAWSAYKGEIWYFFNDGIFDNELSEIVKSNYAILEFDSFDWDMPKKEEIEKIQDEFLSILKNR